MEFPLFMASASATPTTFAIPIKLCYYSLIIFITDTSSSLIKELTYNLNASFSLKHVGATFLVLK